LRAFFGRWSTYLISSAFVALFFYFLDNVLWLLASIDNHNKNTYNAIISKQDEKSHEKITNLPKNENIAGQSINDLYAKR